MNQHASDPSRRRTIVAVLATLALVSGSWAADPPPGFQEAYETGNQALRAADLDAAEKAFRAAAAAAPENTEALLKLGMTLSRKRDYDGAESAYRTLLSIDPRHAQALNNLANVFLRQDRYAEAGDYYGQALKIQPDYLLAQFHYAWVQRQLNHPEEAIRGFEHCLEIQPTRNADRATLSDCRFYLGTLRFRGREFAAAATLMEQVLAERPGHLEAHYYLGMSYRGLGRLDAAREHLAVHRQMLDGKRRTTPIEKPVPQ